MAEIIGLRERAYGCIAILNSMLVGRLDPADEAMRIRAMGYLRAIIDEASDEQLAAAYEKRDR